MDYNVFFQKLDGLLSDKRMDEAEQLLIDNVKKAMEQEDTQALLTVCIASQGDMPSRKCLPIRL